MVSFLSQSLSAKRSFKNALEGDGLCYLKLEMAMAGVKSLTYTQEMRESGGIDYDRKRREVSISKKLERWRAAESYDKEEREHNTIYITNIQKQIQTRHTLVSERSGALVVCEK
ncbi:hypothetical protein L7F22_039857, partial [Adiantum nelumboides]|nr:hypothetical protein [Adiantum nelumboides]